MAGERGGGGGAEGEMKERLFLFIIIKKRKEKNKTTIPGKTKPELQLGTDGARGISLSLSLSLSLRRRCCIRLYPFSPHFFFFFFPRPNGVTSLLFLLQLGLCPTTHPTATAMHTIHHTTVHDRKKKKWGVGGE